MAERVGDEQERFKAGLMWYEILYADQRFKVRI